MKILDIVVHPHLTESVVNKAWMNRLKQEEDIIVHDLYGAYPDRIIDVGKEQQLLQEHDRIVFQFPMYWSAAPRFSSNGRTMCCHMAGHTGLKVRN